MTTSQARGIKQEALNDDSVAEYLQTYPDFFERNAHLLDQAAAAASARRGRNGESGGASGRGAARAQSVARAQAEGIGGRGARQRCAGRPHSSPEPAPDPARTRCRKRSAAHRDQPARGFRCACNSVLVLFLEEARALEPESAASCAPPTRPMPTCKTFESLLQSGKPRCGQIRDAQRDYLFGKDSVEIGSVALTPLGPKGALGILAIGASDAERFHPGMSTEFLSRIGELVTYALTR